MLPFDRVDDLGMTVAEDHRPPGADVIDIGIAVDIIDFRAGGAFDEDRFAADGAKGAHRTVDAAGDDLVGFGKVF